MQELTLQLTTQQVNVILDALGARPYVEVYELIASIQRQARSQLAAPSVSPEGSAPHEAK